MDVYFGARLFESLSQIPSGTGGSFATINPDSINAFVYFALATLRGAGEHGLKDEDVEEAFPKTPATTTSGFVGAKEERTEAKAALGLMETWVKVADLRIGSLAAELDQYVQPSWNDLNSNSLATATLLAGGEVDAKGRGSACGTHPGVPTVCPVPGSRVTQSIVDRITAEANRVGLLRQRLSGKPTQKELAEAAQKGTQPPENRSIALKRRKRATAASFTAGGKSGRRRPADKFVLPESFFSLPNLGDQAALLLDIYAEAFIDATHAPSIVSFILRNAERPDQKTAVTLKKLASAKL